MPVSPKSNMSEQNLNQTEKFLVAGIITSPNFQRARFIASKLHMCYPKLYETPEIRPMLNVAWEEYFTKVKRKYGNGLYMLNKPVAVFLNEYFLGDDETLLHYVSTKFRISIKNDWYEIGKNHLVNHLRDIMGKFRQLAYVTVSIRHKVIGTMLFELYNDLVPNTCENFMDKCKAEVDGYCGSPVHRIVKNSWIQCGGWNLKEKRMRCENYIVPHDRRGILSMCNTGIHKRNSTQFFISLAPTPWMNYRYVAFGQMLQGAEILKQLEQVKTYYESPQDRIDIVRCGEVTFDLEVTDVDGSQKFEKICPDTLLDSLLGPRDVQVPSYGSVFSFSKFRRGDYSLRTDLRSYIWPYVDLPDYLASTYGADDGRLAAVAEGVDDYYIYPKHLKIYDYDSINDQAELADQIFKKELDDYDAFPSQPSISDITI